MSDNQKKADQIMYRTYTKMVLLVNEARTTQESRSAGGKIDKWFNLEVADSDLFKEHLKLYRSVSAAPAPHPLVVQVLLSVPELSNSDQVLVCQTPDSNRTRVDPVPKHILLEEWTLDFKTSSHSTLWAADDDDDGGPVAPSTIYKHGIPLFRSLYSLLRVLPVWKLFKKLRRRNGAGRNSHLSIQLRLKDNAAETSGLLGFEKPIASNLRPLTTQTHSFPSIPHPSGSLTLSAQYLCEPNFQLVELESLLSSRFMTEASDFTPTLTQQQVYHSNSPGSLPIHVSLPQSLPGSIADRFILPRTDTNISTTTAALTSESPQNVPVPTNRAVSGSLAIAVGVSSVSISRQAGSGWIREDAGPSTIRSPKEGNTPSRGADLPSAPVGMPVRRPSVNPVHPFKPSTLSSGSPSFHSSPSFRQPSPLSSGLPPTVGTPSSSRMPPSPIGSGNRASPPFAAFPPSSLGDRRSITSNETDDISKIPARKRYSSSFGKRYAAGSGIASDGSGGSGERREIDRGSYINPTDDDDISLFVQEIDSRKPLKSHQRIRSEDNTPLHLRDIPPYAGDRAHRPAASLDSAHPALPNVPRNDVGERLRELNRVFSESLHGLERRSCVESVPQDPERTPLDEVFVEESPDSNRPSPLLGISRLPTRFISGSGTPSEFGGGSDEVLGRMSLEDRRSGRLH